jgi:hypothetical protein
MNRRAPWLVVLAVTASGCGWSEYAGAPQEAPSPPQSPRSTIKASCAAGALRLGPGPDVSAATGQNPVVLRVMNRGPACVLTGYPGLRFLDRNGAAIPFVVRGSGDQMVTAARPRAVRMRHGGTAFFAINRYRCDRGDVTTVAAVAVTIRSHALRPVPEIRWGYCGAGDPGSIVHVSPFARSVNATLRQG